MQQSLVGMYNWELPVHSATGHGTGVDLFVGRQRKVRTHSTHLSNLMQCARYWHPGHRKGRCASQNCSRQNFVVSHSCWLTLMHATWKSRYMALHKHTNNLQLPYPLGPAHYTSACRRPCDDKQTPHYLLPRGHTTVGAAKKPCFVNGASIVHGAY
jgi:hypothetical protein